MKKKISKKYTQQAAHNSESKLYLRDCLCKTSSNGKRMREEILKRITKHRSFSLFGSVHSHWVAYYRRFLFLISRRSRLLFSLHLWWIQVTVSDPLHKGFMSYKRCHGWSISKPLSRLFHACDVSVFFCLWDAVMSGWQRQSKRKDEKFWQWTAK